MGSVPGATVRGGKVFGAGALVPTVGIPEAGSNVPWNAVLKAPALLLGIIDLF